MYKKSRPRRAPETPEATCAARQVAPGVRIRIDDHWVPVGAGPAHGWVDVEDVLAVRGEPGMTAILWRAGTAAGVAFYQNLEQVLVRGTAAARRWWTA